MRHVELPPGIIERVRPEIRSLRARVIDEKSQLLIWDKPVGGRLVAYSIRFRVNGVRDDWREVRNEDVYRGDAYHALKILVPDADPADVVVSVRAMNEHRHSDPVPETHLAADYKVIVGDKRHDEPRHNRSLRKPHLLMSHDGRVNLDENLMDWATTRVEWMFWNYTLEEVLYFGRSNGNARTFEVRRVLTDSNGELSEVAVPANAAATRIDRVEYEPDFFILTSTRGSFFSINDLILEHSEDDLPDWSRSLQKLNPDGGFIKHLGRTFHWFTNDTPGCWQTAARVVAMHETGCQEWMAGGQHDAVRALHECGTDQVIGGTVRGDSFVGCYATDRGELKVRLEWNDERDTKVFTLRLGASEPRLMADTRRLKR